MFLVYVKLDEPLRKTDQSNSNHIPVAVDEDDSRMFLWFLPVLESGLPCDVDRLPPGLPSKQTCDHCDRLKNT